MLYTKTVNKTYLTFLYFTIIVSFFVIKAIQYPPKCDGSTDNIEKLQRFKIKTLDDFLNSSFIKKYTLRLGMDSWPLRRKFTSAEKRKYLICGQLVLFC